MSILSDIFDAYELRARLFPMLLVLMPIALGLAAWAPGSDLVDLAGGAAISVAGAALLSQLARDRGKKSEPGLFRSWGGVPSVRALSYQSNIFDEASLRRFHALLSHHLADLWFPLSFDEEVDNPDHAERSFRAASELLRNLTRDRERFRLVFAENVNYGYRRNLWAMKGVGLAFSLLGTFAGLARATSELVAGQRVSASATAAVSVGVLLIILWLFRVNRPWVRIAADAYARQLISSVDALLPSEP
jgi:hypothetical protein